MLKRKYLNLVLEQHFIYSDYFGNTKKLQRAFSSSAINGETRLVGLNINDLKIPRSKLRQFHRPWSEDVKKQKILALIWRWGCMG